jgi:hypothetical protein
MSYIEEKYKNKIAETFESLRDSEEKLINLFKRKSINIADEVAQLCAHITKQINLILKKYYPEIIKMEYKIEIKSLLKFYFDLIDKLTDFIRHCENFDKLDEKYYEAILNFVKEKDMLIKRKYNNIVTRELTNFYDTKSRNALEKIISQKFEREREYFTLGSLEAEIRKIAKIAGAETISIKKADKEEKNILSSANSVVHYSAKNEDLNEKVEKELQDFLTSKQYETKPYGTSILTNANLLCDDKN